jgi:predicted transposase YbfD/YdcC
VATLHRVFKRLDVAAFERAVGEWLAQTGVEPTDALAVDGKTLRGIHGDQVPGVHLVAAHTHRAGVILGQLRSAGKGHELAAAKELLGRVPLAGRVVTGDALLTQRAISRRIVDGEGDYLLPVDEHQPKLRAGIERAFSPVADERAQGARAAARRAVPGARPRRGRRADRRGHEGRAEGAARAQGGADAVGAA